MQNQEMTESAWTTQSSTTNGILEQIRSSSSEILYRDISIQDIENLVQDMQESDRRRRALATEGDFTRMTVSHYGTNHYIDFETYSLTVSEEQLENRFESLGEDFKALEKSVENDDLSEEAKKLFNELKEQYKYERRLNNLARKSRLD